MRHKLLMLVTAAAVGAVAGCQPHNDYDVDNNVVVIGNDEDFNNIDRNVIDQPCDDPNTVEHEACE